MYQQHLIEHALAGGRGKGDEKEKKLKAVVELGVAMMTILVIATAVAKTVVVVVVKEMGKVVGKRVRKAVVTTVTAVEKNKIKESENARVQPHNFHNFPIFYMLISFQ